MSKTPEECIMLLMHLRDDYSEEMPTAKVDAHPATHKVQVGWFKSADVVISAWSMKHLSPGVCAGIQSARAALWNKLNCTDWTTADDIRQMNMVIDVVIWDLLRLT